RVSLCPTQRRQRLPRLVVTYRAGGELQAQPSPNRVVDDAPGHHTGGAPGRRARVLGFADLGQYGVELTVGALGQDGAEQLLFAAEVRVDRALAEAGGMSDVVQSGFGIAMLGEHPHRRVQQPTANFRARRAWYRRWG